MTGRNIKLISILVCMVAILASCQGNIASKSELPLATSMGSGEPKAITADGQTLLVVRTLAEHNEGWLVAVDGSTSHKILEFTATAFNAAFSPDGKHLVWATDELWLAKADGSEAEILLTDAAGLGPLVWSPDSRHIAFAQAESIKTTDLAGNVTTVTTAIESVRQLAWAELEGAEERLFFNSFPAEAPPFVSSITPTGQDERRLAEAEFFAVQDKTLYLTDPFAEGRLWTVDAFTGTDLSVIMTEQVQDFAPRPNSSGQVVVLQQAGEFAYELWLARVADQKLTQLTSDSLAIAPLWSPDGRYLYYALFDFAAGEEVDDPFEVMRIEVPA